MSNNRETKETLFVVDGQIRNWIDYTTAMAIAVWTFIRPARWESEAWKVYLVTIITNDRLTIPMSATDIDYLWRKIVDHPDFRALIHSSCCRVKIEIEAWSIDGRRLTSNDINISGSKVVFNRHEVTKEEQEEYCQTVCRKYKDNFGYDDHCCQCPDNPVPYTEEEEQPASSLGALLKENLGTSFGKR
jgi:hypothetical protein